jgi:hypothetical protein
VLIAKARRLLPEDQERAEGAAADRPARRRIRLNMPLMTRSNVYANKPAASSG